VRLTSPVLVRAAESPLMIVVDGIEGRVFR
jgi:hypothetical protein